MVIYKKIEICADNELVFKALTTASLVSLYLPLEQMKCQLLHGAGLLPAGDNRAIDEGAINLIVPNKSFQFSYWHKNHGTKNRREYWVTTSYEVTSGLSGSVLHVVQSNIPSEQYRQFAELMWDKLLTSLKAFIEGNQALLRTAQ